MKLYGWELNCESQSTWVISGVLVLDIYASDRSQGSLSLDDF